MPKNSLFIDDQYQFDCEHKINYLESLENNSSIIKNNISNNYYKDEENKVYSVKKILDVENNAIDTYYKVYKDPSPQQENPSENI